ncbi:hypothetical protein GCM10009734_66470 [Nonomuraea bangladeshensis]
MRIEHIIVAIIVIWAGLVFVRAQSRSALDKAKPSLPVRAMQAAGANVEAKRLIPAVAELGERAVVALAGRARETVTARVGGARERRAERREERRAVRDERLGDFGQRVRDIAAKAGAAVGDGAARRWEGRAGDRPMVDRPADARSAGDRPARPRWRLLRRFVWWRNRDGRTAPNGTPDDGTLPTLTHDTVCRRCGTEHSVTIPEGENSGEVMCDCRNRVIIFRDLKGNPPPVTDPDAWVAFQTLVAAEAGYCTSIKCTGNGTYVEVTPEGIRHVRCPQCTTNKEESMSDTTMTQPNIPAQAGGPATTEAAPAVQAPADWRTLAVRVADFNPDDDADLINFMTQEIAGMAAYASAYESVFQTCTGSLGLDPRSVQALGEFGENFVQITAEMARARARFVAIYEEVMRMVADGTVMPHNGRFFTGNVPV